MDMKGEHMLSGRRLDVLRAIVAEYVRTREPVGSKAIAAGHDLGVSSATIRNDMAALEEYGLIYQPHTSAGRVPTDKGYRLFVDQLSAVKPMSVPEAKAVESFLGECVEMDDIVQRTVRLLAQATHQVAVMQYPHTTSTHLRRVDMVDITPRRLLIVVIADNGTVEQRFIEVADPIDSDTIATLNQRLNSALLGLNAHDIRALAVGESNDQVILAPTHLLTTIMSTIAELLTPPAEIKLAVAGLSNLARAGVEFRDVVPLLDALEEQVVLLRLFAEHSHATNDIHVTIGTENPDDVLAEASVITSHYGTPAGPPGTVANLGVVGPMRMDYAHTITTVRSVAAYLSRYFTRGT